MWLSLIENLKAKDMVGEAFAKLLPGDLLAHAIEIVRDLALIRRVRITFEVFSLTFDHNDAMNRFSVSSALHDKIGVYPAALIALNSEVLRADEIAIPPKNVRIAVEAEGDAPLVPVVRMILADL